MPADVSQLRAIAAKQARAAKLLPEAASTAVDKAAYLLVDQMQTQIHAMGAVDTGNLLASVDARFGPDGLTASVGPTVDYAEYVHDGTYRMAPRPFATNAARIVGPNFEAAIRTVGEMLA